MLERLLKNRRGSSPRILLIDDDPLFGRSLGRIAREHGLSLTHWSSLDRKDLRVISRYELLIIDYELEHITSFQLLERLEHPLGIPILLVSAYGRLGEAALPAGVSAFVPKSIGMIPVMNAALSLLRASVLLGSLPID